MLFLSAEWRYLVMMNFEVGPEVLLPLVPRGTELDLWDNAAIVSLVGFQFLNTRVLGVPVPFHRDFEEVNLRFYVKRHHQGETRRGVVFIKEIVPMAAITFVARTVYGENYVTLKMGRRHVIDGARNTIEYNWLFSGNTNHIRASFDHDPVAPAEGSEEQFITEHYWGYTRQTNGGTVEYRVEHPSWRVWTADSFDFHCDAGELYGRQFASPLKNEPRSVFVADGSAVQVMTGHRIS